MESSPIVVSVQTFVIRVNGKVAGATATELDKVLVEIESGKAGWFTYYTLDGSAPDDTSGTFYDIPFELTSGATVRALAYAPDYSDELNGPTVEVLVYKSQVLTVVAPQGVVYGAVPVSLVGSSDSGLPLSYEVLEGPGKMEGGGFQGDGSRVGEVEGEAGRQ